MTPDDIHVVNDLHLPVNEEILIDLKSADVLHSFFLPNMRVKQDAVPGMKIPVWFRATEKGTYDIVCAELCGWGHYKMKGRLTIRVARGLRRVARPKVSRANGYRGRTARSGRGRVNEHHYGWFRTSTMMPTATRMRAASWAPMCSRRDHKIIGIQFLFSTLIWFLIGGLLALGIRWQVAWPWAEMPVIGKMLFANEGGQISPEFYTILFTMHATVMIFFVIIPILAGAFGNYLIPLMIGADDMAFPTLNMLSYWFMWPAFVAIGASFFVEGGAAKAGWTSYPPLSLTDLNGQTLWLIGLTFVGVSSMMGSVNYMTTIIQMRAPA